MQPVVIGIIVIIVFVLIRLIASGTTSHGARHSSAEQGRRDFAKVEAYENRINSLQRAVKGSKNDRQREMFAKKMEMLLKQKEKLKHKTEREIRRA